MLNNTKKYEFSVKIKNKPLIEYETNGDTFIEGRKGSEYELYFKNNSYKRVLVLFSVDGLSVMDGKTASDKSKGYIVEAYKDLTVPGWTINSNKVAKFQFQPQNDHSNTTYVELLQEEGFKVDITNQGILGCMVFEEKYVAPKYVYDFPPYQYPYPYPYEYYPYQYYPYQRANQFVYNCDTITSSYSGRSSSCDTIGPMAMNQADSVFNCFREAKPQALGTKFGDDAKFETVTKSFEKEENPSWIGILNYDTIQGLRKRGIFVIKSNHAKAFPDYNELGCHIPHKR